MWRSDYKMDYFPHQEIQKENCNLAGHAKYTAFVALVLCLLVVAAAERFLPCQRRDANAFQKKNFDFCLTSAATLMISAAAPSKCKWKKGNTIGRKVANGMDLASTLTNVASIASTGLELNMVLVKNINGDTSIIIGQIMLVTATLLAINHKEPQSLKTCLLTIKIRSYLFMDV
ncbi:hypothetical protein RND71_009538 [Anisodus tanguticus]|uniref:Uncharacterized protein n=1 Tax=Anisodus tanguticus TaxID=243964 RepID=A0AAE1SFM0_9SOLA|nr:hypothetical protein RND71_009538 [Anisodus tanguticus]